MLRRIRLVLGSAGAIATIGFMAGALRHTPALPVPQPASDSVPLSLATGTLMLSEATTVAFFQSARSAPRWGVEGFAKFRRRITVEDRTALAGRGLMLIAPLGSNTYRVRATARARRGDALVQSLLTHAAELRLRDRVAPRLLARAEGRSDSHPRRIRRSDPAVRIDPDSAIRVIVEFQRDVPEATMSMALSATQSRQPAGPRRWWAVVRRDDILRIAAAPGVMWIEHVPGTVSVDNAETRAQVGVDLIQQFDVATGVSLGLGGAGIQVGVFDLGLDEAHRDFSRLPAGPPAHRVVGTETAKTLHGTMVAGVIAGNGFNSGGATPYKWRGMAPEAELIEVAIATITSPETELIFDPPALANRFHSVIGTHGMDLSNHAYQIEYEYVYGKLSAQRDSMIRGDARTPAGNIIPPRVQVFSSGNWGVSDVAPMSDDVELYGYFSLNFGETKNGISVGNYDPAGPTLDKHSSIGPTWDGRIKPDLVAPGINIQSPAWVHGTETVCGSLPTGPTPIANAYATDCGTSLSAAVVSGIVAMLMPHYRKTFRSPGIPHFVEILRKRLLYPSTMRALLTHTADDISSPTWFVHVDGPVQAFPGPDMVTGFGLVNAAVAKDVISRREIVEGSIQATCDADTLEFKVVEDAPGAGAKVKVTLAWDDPSPHAIPLRGSILLRNDLDLILVDPAGTVHYPWQVNQVIMDGTGTELRADQQPCGAEIVVKQRLTAPGPVTAPELAASHSGKGRDHLNNIEQVMVDAGMAGTWKAIITGFDLQDSPQGYSLIGVPRVIHLQSDLGKFCQRYQVLCPRIINICQRYPLLCSGPPNVIPVFPPGPRLTFRDTADRVILSLRNVCAALDVAAGCLADGLRPYRVEARLPAAVSAAVYDAQGTQLASAGAGQRLQFTHVPGRGAELIIIFTPSARMRRETYYTVPMTIRR